MKKPNDRLRWRAFQFQPLSGVYILLLVGKVQYVGESTDVYNRVRAHRVEKRIAFDAVGTISGDREQRRKIEKALVQKYSPPFNLAYTDRWGQPSTRARLIPFEFKKSTARFLRHESERTGKSMVRIVEELLEQRAAMKPA